MNTTLHTVAFEEAVDTYTDTLYRVALHHCNTPEDAEDIVQDVFLRLLSRTEEFESETHRKAWLLRVAINRAHDFTRAAHNKNVELSETLPAPSDENSELLDVIRTLPAHYRDTIYLHYYEGYTAAEIGEILDKPTNTILSWMRRARKQLEELLQEELQ